MNLYYIDVDKVGQQTNYILAESKEKALEDAKVLAESSDNSQWAWHYEFDTGQIKTLGYPVPAWSGGPGGKWVEVEDVESL